ncbi:DUF5085 family protein [Paenibacillus tarimensis]|uniref:DUF5085 family protein n=1 Tax=Paenibacillus tarimensis TaxID=416012 RepID=UPI001F3C8FED|nr:DUF5085 family protein [Paenibacillus tarimensis]MCF2942881.1 DUF5085 family protein [Paenibacillus tarimensis]
MKIKRKPLVFHNVISTTATCGENEWHQIAQELRNAVLQNGLYGTGPVMYQIGNVNPLSGEAEYSFHIPVNSPVSMPANNKYSFTKLLHIPDGLVFRHADLEEELDPSYELLRQTAGTSGLTLQEPFYHIYLDVYGGGMIDIFAPISGEA